MCVRMSTQTQKKEKKGPRKIERKRARKKSNYGKTKREKASEEIRMIETKYKKMIKLRK